MFTLGVCLDNVAWRDVMWCGVDADCEYLGPLMEQEVVIGMYNVCVTCVW